MAMKLCIAGSCLAGLLGLVSAQDRLPQEETARYAKVCVEQLGDLADAQIRVVADPAKACAVRGEGGGAMVVPDGKLSAAKLAKIGKDVVPVGQLWLRKWTVVVDGRPVSRDQLRMVTVNVDDKNRPMPLLLLGMRKVGTNLELVGYAQGSEPLLKLPLKTVEFVQELPLDLEWQRGEKNVDPLTLSILGRYQAVIPTTRTEK